MVASLLVLKGPLGGFTAPGRLAALLLILAAPVYVLQLSVQSVLIGNGALAALTKLQLFTAITLTSGVVILAISHDLTTTSYAILYGSAIVAVALATVASVAKKPRFRSNLKPVLVFGLKAAPAGLANFASIRLDQILLAPLLGARPLGIYAVAVSVASVPNALGSAIAVASYKTVAASAVQSDEAALSEAARSIRVCFIGTGLLAVVVGAPAALAVPFLFGNDFRGAVLPLVILLPGSVALAASMTAHSTLIAIGRPLAASLGELVGLTVTAVGLAVFVRRFGVVGAAVVSTTAYVFTMVVFLSILYRRGARHLLPRSRDIKIQMEWLRSRARAIAQRI
jgi:O-antigen/teichoic acid export membrane protein